MTTPKVSTTSKGGSRFYVDPDNHSLKYPGVTSVIGKYDKEFLQFWAAKKVAETAVDNITSITGIVLNGDRQGAIDYLKGAPRRDTAQAADGGTAVHTMVEKMALGLPVGRITPELRPFYDAFADYLAEVEPEYLYVEETIWDDEHQYAGSFDAVIRMTKDYGPWHEGDVLFLDNKTTRSGVHEEVGLQLAAYRFAQYILRKDGTRVPNVKAQGAAVLLLRPEGAKLVPIRADEAMFEIFCALRTAFPFTTADVKNTIIGDPAWAYGEFLEEQATGPKRRVAKPRAPRRTTAPVED